MLLSHKKWDDKIYSYMDGPIDCHNEWNKSDRQISYDIAYMWNLKKWYNWTYLQNRNRVTDVENKLIVQFTSVVPSCPTLCDPMNYSTQGLPVHHQLPEFTQTHVHWVGDAIHPSHPLSSPSPALNLSQHQGLFQWVSSSHQVAKVLRVSASASVLPVNTQDWSPLGYWVDAI